MKTDIDNRNLAGGFASIFKKHEARDVCVGHGEVKERKI
jgi:hypothetical protein